MLRKLRKKAVKGADAAKKVAKAVTRLRLKTVKKAAKKDIKVKAFVECMYGKQGRRERHHCPCDKKAMDRNLVRKSETLKRWIFT